MTRVAMAGAAMALAVVAAVGFIGVAIHEFGYAGQTTPTPTAPRRSSPRGGCAGAVLCIAVALLALALTRPAEPRVKAP